MKFTPLIVETVLILAFLLIAGCIAAIVYRPDTGTGIIVMITALAGIATSTIFQLRATAKTAVQIENVKQQTNGINTTLLANLDTVVKHITGEVPLDTGAITQVKANITAAAAQIDQTKGIGK